LPPIGKQAGASGRARPFWYLPRKPTLDINHAPLSRLHKFRQSPAVTAPAPFEIILLAAGRSERMRGTNKLLLPVGGEPLLRRSARLWLDAGHPVLVVTGRDDNAPRAALAGLPVRFVANPMADQGQHTSVAAGLAAADCSGRAVAIALADQPLLTGADIRALLTCFDSYAGKFIVIPRHGNARGNPVLLPAAVARQLRDEPELGPARRFIDDNPVLVRWFDADSDHFTTDIDTPEDVTRVLSRDS